MQETIETILRNKTKTKQFVNKFYPITNFVPGGGLICCPFHDDSSPSAKIYYDKDYPRLYCYACNKQYGSADYIELILGKDLKTFVRECEQNNKQQTEAFAGSYVPFELTRTSYPIKEKVSQHMKEFSTEGLARLLSALYYDADRDV